MRRVWLLVTLMLFGASFRASAQVRASVTVALDSSGRQPVLQVTHLFEEKEWRDAVQSGVGVKLHWTLVLWQKGLIRGKVQEQTWIELVTRQALLGLYDFQRILPRGAEAPKSFPSLDQLNLEIFARPLPLHLTLPARAGEYYYSLDLEVVTMDDDDQESVSRFQGPSFWGRLTRPLSAAFLPGKVFPTVQTATFRIP